MDSKCKKGKKNSNPKANKQPQRGLGVAQLEKIRMQNQMMANYNYQHYPSYSSPIQSSSEIEYIDASRINTLYGISYHNASIRTSVHGAESISLPHNSIGEPNAMLSSKCIEGSLQTPSTTYHYFFESNDSQEIDLELRL